jgi:hypothetical protein
MAKFEQRLAFGKIGESYIAMWLREVCHYNVLPVYEKEIAEGKGPVLFAHQRGNLIAPDLLCFRGCAPETAEYKWIEAKTKNAFTWHRISGKWTTGIDLRHYADYLKVAALSPFPVWLLFLHMDGRAKDTPDGKVSPTGLFGGELKQLRDMESHRSPKWGRYGMVYWVHEKLTRLATLDQVMKVIEVDETDDLIAYGIKELGGKLVQLPLLDEVAP